MKLFISVFFVIFGVFGLSACSGKKSDETNSVNPRAPGEKPGKPGEKPGGSRELTVSDKFFIRAVHGQRISHEIFSELWMHIWENRMSRPNSIFLDLMQFIETHRDPKANHYILKNNQCP